MEKVCACIPEMPKIIDGDLYAYVDILDTKNGRLLKTLCDYGFVPGISSRGSGDVDINDEVDPETFYLETFDIVALPAVKKARLTMCEQLDEKSMKLKKALTESLNAASAEDRKIMKEALNNLNININEELNLDDIPERPKYIDELEASAKLNEAAEEAEDEEVKETPVEEAEEAPEEPEKPEEAEKEAAEEESNESETPTIKDFVGQFSEFDENLPIEFKPISIEGKEYVVNEFSLDDSEEGKLVIEIGYDSEMNDNIEKAEGEFRCLAMEEYGKILGRCISLLPPETVVHRITGDGARRELIAPIWSLDKKKVLNYLNHILRATGQEEKKGL